MTLASSGMPQKTKTNGNPDSPVYLTYPTSKHEAAQQHRRLEDSFHRNINPHPTGSKMCGLTVLLRPMRKKRNFVPLCLKIGKKP